MSSTRTAKPGSPLKQNRYASSPELSTGLRGNLVALRCETITSGEDRELVWGVQQASYRDGGLKKLAADLIATFPEHIATRSLFASVMRSGRNLNAEQVRTIRSELPRAEQDAFLLKGETFLSESEAAVAAMQDFLKRPRNYDDEVDEALRRAMMGDEERDREEAKAAARPNSYPAESFYRLCQKAAHDSLESVLQQLCLDPAMDLEGFSIWYFHDLLACLRRHVCGLGQTQLATLGFTETALSRVISGEIDNAYEDGGLVLLHNSAGNGKSFSAQASCVARPGRARYASAPATNTEIDFWRCIAEAIGTADGLSYKCEQIRTRVKQTLIESGLVLVMDAAQNLFPVSDYRYALPARLNQILELAEQGVSIVLIADSKLFDTLGFVEARTGWSRSKFVNQLSRVVELPAALAKEDVQSVAASLLPDGDRTAQRKLADYMIVAPGYLHSGSPAAKRARRIAASNHRDRITLADMEEALETSIKPSFMALESGLKRADAAAAKCKSKVRNWRPETPAQLAAKSGRRRNQIVTSSDLKRTAMPPPADDSEAGETNFRPSGTNRIGNPDAVAIRRQTALDLVTA